ncbi:MAG: hypothetical protein LBS69_11225 [Prevotellaceae bacterium]|jgi:hypothetical protein|nr:hypothetical protein [Prevotellaceae bacterium]
MKKKLTKFMANMLLVAAIAAVAASCSKDDPAPAKKQSDVYVAGTESNGSAYVVKGWKNGVATALTDGTNDAGANSVYVSGDDVYVAGREYSGNKSVAKVWKNGKATALTDGTNSAAAS